MALELETGTDPIRLVRRSRSGGGVRVFTRLSRRDAVAWHALAGRIGAVIEERLDRRVVANRMARTGARWLLESMDRAAERGRAVSAIHVGRVLQTDVEDFYASVRPATTWWALRGAGVDAAEAFRAVSMLRAWERQGLRGLPVGPPGSAVVANAVLMGVDASLGARPFVRWVDDYRIAVASDDDAAALLPRIDATLAELGLRRSEEKTVVGPARELRWPGAASACRP